MDPSPNSRRLLAVAVVLGLLVAGDLALFGWLLFRALSEREMSQALVEARVEGEGLAERLAERARQQGDDLYTAIASEVETQTYIDSILRQRQLVRDVEIRDREDRLVYRMRTEETIPLDRDAVLEPGVEVPGIEERRVERQTSYDVPYDLTIPIEDMGRIHIGVSRDELERRTEVLRQELVRQASVVGGVTGVLLLTGLGVIWSLMRRSEGLTVRAREAERMAYLGTLAAGLAHEIRNPLNSLRLNVQLLGEEMEGARSTTGDRLLSITGSEIQRLDRLVNDFLTYARPRSLEATPVPAVELLRAARDVTAAECRELGVESSVVDDTGGAAVEVDQQQARQLLLNLIQNALAAMGESPGRPPRLELAARSLDDRIGLDVIDNGPGIPEEAKSQAVELFYSTRKGGTGLGLAIAKRIVEAHGGELRLLDTPGGGTTARVLLPRAAAGRSPRVP